MQTLRELKSSSGKSEPMRKHSMIVISMPPESKIAKEIVSDSIRVPQASLSVAHVSVAYWVIKNITSIRFLRSFEKH